MTSACIDHLPDETSRLQLLESHLLGTDLDLIVEGNETLRAFTRRSLNIQRMKSLVKTLKAIQDSVDDLFSLKAAVNEKSGPEFVCSPLGRDLRGNLTSDVLESIRGFRSHALHPMLKLIADHANLVDNSMLEGLRNPQFLNASETKTVLMFWTDWVKTLRTHLNHPGFRKAQKSFRDVARKTERGTLKYIKAILDRYSRLLVIRIDLSYGKDLATLLTVRGDAFQDPVFERRNGAGVKTAAIGWRKTKAHKGAFQRYLQQRYGKALRGFIWKIEYGVEKGYHHHVMVFLDAQAHARDVLIAQEMGEHWRSEITDGKGIYYNCNADKSKYTMNGLGEVKYHDQAKRAGLNLAAQYLCKHDEVIQGALPRGHRALTRGRLPKSGVKPGPKRKAVTPELTSIVLPFN